MGCTLFGQSVLVHRRRNAAIFRLPVHDATLSQLTAHACGALVALLGPKVPLWPVSLATVHRTRRRLNCRYGAAGAERHLFRYLIIQQQTHREHCPNKALLVCPATTISTLPPLSSPRHHRRTAPSRYSDRRRDSPGSSPSDACVFITRQTKAPASSVFSSLQPHHTSRSFVRTHPTIQLQSYR